MTEKSFKIVIGRSKWLLIYLLIVHGLMLSVMMTLLTNSWSSFIAVVVISISLIYYCQRYQWLKSHRTVIDIERDSKHRWRLLYSGDTSEDNLDLKHCVVTSNLIILYFSGASLWRTQSVTIVADSIDVELFRLLRVYCRDPKLFQR